MDCNATKKYLVTFYLNFAGKNMVVGTKSGALVFYSSPPANVLRFGYLDFFLNRVNLVQVFLLLMWPVIKKQLLLYIASLRGLVM